MSLPFLPHNQHRVELRRSVNNVNLNCLRLHEPLDAVNRLYEVVKLIRRPDEYGPIAMPLKVATTSKQLRLAT